jgi:hypothetical protein
LRSEEVLLASARAGKSRFKRAHKTHELGRCAGESYPHPAAEVDPSRAHATDEASRLYGEPCELGPDATARTSLVGVSTAIDEAWRRGERLPVLRAHRKLIERARRESRTRFRTEP